MIDNYSPFVLPLRGPLVDDSGRMAKPWLDLIAALGRKAGRSMVWRGKYADSLEYAVCDVVFAANSLWIANQANPVDGAAVTPGTEATVWELVLACHGIPEGGTDGQVLAKASDDDYDVEWVDSTGGGGGAFGFELMVNGDVIDEGVTINA